MAVDPFLSFEAALPSIIAESPSQILRVRETAADSFHAAIPYTQGPYSVRIEPMKAGTAKDVWDEKGGNAVMLFEMIGYNLPTTVTEGGVTVKLFKPNDTVTDQDGNVYRVASPQYVRGKFRKVTLELMG
jgi:hypothetical protein